VSGGILVISTRIIDLRAYFGNKQVPGGEWVFFHHLEGLDPVTGRDAYLGCYRPDAADDRDGFEYYWAAADDSKVRGGTWRRSIQGTTAAYRCRQISFLC